MKSLLLKIMKKLIIILVFAFWGCVTAVDETIEGDLTITGDNSVGGDLTVTGGGQIGSILVLPFASPLLLGANGVDTVLNFQDNTVGKLTYRGSTDDVFEFNKGFEINGDFTMQDGDDIIGNIDFTGSIDIAGSLDVVGNVDGDTITANSDLIVQGDESFFGVESADHRIWFAVSGPSWFYDDSDTSVLLDGGNLILEQTLEFDPPGADVDITVLNIAVTGTPALVWDESDDQLELNKGLENEYWKNEDFVKNTGVALTSGSDEDWILDISDDTSAVVELIVHLQGNTAGNSGSYYLKAHVSQELTTPDVNNLHSDNAGDTAFIVAPSTSDTGGAGRVTWNLTNDIGENGTVDYWFRAYSPNSKGSVSVTGP